MSKNIWIYVAGIVTIITTIILGLLIPHLSISLYYVALGFLVIAEFVFFLTNGYQASVYRLATYQCSYCNLGTWASFHDASSTDFTQFSILDY